MPSKVSPRAVFADLGFQMDKNPLEGPLGGHGSVLKVWAPGNGGGGASLIFWVCNLPGAEFSALLTESPLFLPGLLRGGPFTSVVT